MLAALDIMFPHPNTFQLKTVATSTSIAPRPPSKLPHRCSRHRFEKPWVRLSAKIPVDWSRFRKQTARNPTAFQQMVNWLMKYGAPSFHSTQQWRKWIKNKHDSNKSNIIQGQLKLVAPFFFLFRSLGDQPLHVVNVSTGGCVVHGRTLSGICRFQGCLAQLGHLGTKTWWKVEVLRSLVLTHGLWEVKMEETLREYGGKTSIDGSFKNTFQNIRKTPSSSPLLIYTSTVMNQTNIRPSKTIQKTATVSWPSESPQRAALISAGFRRPRSPPNRPPFDGSDP